MRLPVSAGGTSGALDAGLYWTPDAAGARARYLQHWKRGWGSIGAFAEGYVEYRDTLDYGVLGGLQIRW